MSLQVQTAGPGDVVPPKVALGFSEGLAVVAAVATLLITLFGQDWGIGTAVRVVSAAGPTLLPGLVALSRAGKHRSANSMVAAVLSARATADAQVNAAALVRPLPPSAFAVGPVQPVEPAPAPTPVEPAPAPAPVEPAPAAPAPPVVARAVSDL